MKNRTGSVWRERVRDPETPRATQRVLNLLDALLAICEGRNSALADAEVGDLPDLAEAMRAVAAALTVEAGALEDDCADPRIVAGEAAAMPRADQPGLFDVEPGTTTPTIH